MYVVIRNRLCRCVFWFGKVVMIYGCSYKFIIINLREEEGGWRERMVGRNVL